MKFGLYFHRYIVPKWDEFYVDYNGLRQLMRKAAQTNAEPDFAEVYGCLSTNLETIQNFRHNREESLFRRRAEIFAICGPPAHPIAVSKLENVQHSELRLVLASCEECLQELKERQWFGTVNEVAVAKIFKKLAKYGQGNTEPYLHLHSQWVSSQERQDLSRLGMLEQINTLTYQISSALTSSQPRTISLCISSLNHSKPPALDCVNALYHSIQKDQESHVAELLSEKAVAIEMELHPGPLLRHVFKLSTILSSNRTALLLLSDPLLKEHLDIDPECFSFFVRTHGQLIQSSHRLARDVSTQEPQQTVSPMDLLLKILDVLGPRAVDVLAERDAWGRSPLHYAAKYNLGDFCETLISRCKRFEAHDEISSALLSEDEENRTPLHHAVLAGHPSMLAVLIKHLFTTVIDPKTVQARTILGDLLLLSLRAQQDDIVKLLLNQKVDLNYRSKRGQTALYSAAQAGRLDYVQLLTCQMCQQGVGLDIPTSSQGWTPLMVACANGHGDIVEFLLSAGAKKEATDIFGWTAQEHATLRGHLAISDVFGMAKSAYLVGGPASSLRQIHGDHRVSCDAGQKLLIVNIGSTQSSYEGAAIKLNDSTSLVGPNTGNALPCVLEISALGSETHSQRVQLPILEDLVNVPFIFQVKESLPLQILVRVYRHHSTTRNVLLGSGVLLDEGKRLFGAHRESLIRERIVPILDQTTMEPAGTVLLSYVVATPFPYLQHAHNHSYLNHPGNSVQLVGHRGLGQNVPDRSYLQLGENTAMSFISAAKLGASFVEFDVQITRDLEPVIYHDFSLSESGTDIPIHDLTLDQYRHASKLQEPRNNSFDFDNHDQSRVEHGRKKRSCSATREFNHEAIDLHDKLRHTVDFKSKGFKPNTRGEFIHDSLATLEELLVELPQDIGFNIEIKYPRFHETVEAGVAPVVIDLNTFIDTALDKIHRFGDKRPIILSSFTPEVCILLSVKQKACPVMFITNAGKLPMSDQELRAASVQAALKFAKRWSLSGIVFACDALLYCPRLVQFVKNAGLVCASYGIMNNTPGKAKLQADAGINMIMVDRVKLIEKVLRDPLAEV